MDTATLAHLDIWLTNMVREEPREAVKTAMLALVAEDPQYWLAQGWSVVFVRSEAREIELAFLKRGL